MDVLTQFINKSESRRLKIAVVGDSVIDEYYAVRVNRVSPEFPIPVLLSENDKPTNIVPGGAANVCYQMKHWNTDVYLLTALGKNTPLNGHGFNCNYSVTLENWNTPRKKRFYDGDFPLDRWDVESKSSSKTPEWSTARCNLLSNFTAMIKDVNPDMVILSDYGKGVFVKGDENISQLMINYCNRKNIPIMVDPKTVNHEFWSGCHTIKPNADWARAFCEKYADHLKSEGKWENEMEYISQALFANEVVLTDSGNGVGIYDRSTEEAEFFNSPALSKKRPIIRSVIGAGDCFCAFFVMARSLGFTLKDAVSIAFNGSSAYIEDKHNSPVTPYMFQKWFDPIGAKKITIDKLIQIKKQSPKQTWVWTNGCFDIIHAGHLKTFEEAKKLGDKLIVGINTDESVKALKGEGRPILRYADRETLVAHLQIVDFVVPISEKKPETIIRQILPNCIVKGGDYKSEDVSGFDVVGVENIHIIPLIPNLSTSRIIDRMKAVT